MEEEGEGSVANAQDQIWDLVKMFVLGMLQNFPQGLTVDEINRNLSMLKGDMFPFHGTAKELGAFLQKLSKEPDSGLEFAAGVYKVRGS